MFADLPKWEFSVVELQPGRYEVTAVRDGGITGRASGMDPDEAMADLREWATKVEAGLSAKQPSGFIECPVCGAPELSSPPYEIWPPPADLTLEPPYQAQLGAPSYEVCANCGFEFGYDDDPGATAAAGTFESYLADWVAQRSPRFERPASTPTSPRQRVRVFEALVSSDEQRGRRVTVWANDAIEATARLRARYGDDAAMSVWNEDDAARPR